MMYFDEERGLKPPGYKYNLYVYANTQNQIFEKIRKKLNSIRKKLNEENIYLVDLKTNNIVVDKSGNPVFIDFENVIFEKQMKKDNVWDFIQGATSNFYTLADFGKQASQNDYEIQAKEISKKPIIEKSLKIHHNFMQNYVFNIEKTKKFFKDLQTVKMNYCLFRMIFLDGNYISTDSSEQNLQQNEKKKYSVHQFTCFYKTLIKVVKFWEKATLCDESSSEGLKPAGLPDRAEKVKEKIIQWTSLFEQEDMLVKKFGIININSDKNEDQEF